MLGTLDCVNNTNIDLHNHTIFSDGDMRPEAVVDKCIREGKEVIAITDHDGIEGSVIALSYSKDKPITVIPGIELDSRDELGKEIHILGYNIDFENPRLHEAIEQARVWRDERNRMMYDILRKHGYEITHEQVNAVNDGIFVGKPSFARALIDGGYAEDVDDAFTNILRKIQEFNNIDKNTHESREIIDIIHDAGGVAVMAHPMEQHLRGEDWNDFYKRVVVIMDRMVEYGAEGIECYHPSAIPEEQEMLRRYAESRGLLITRGTDFHSEVRLRRYARN